MARRSGLGKGLSSLIPPGETEPGDSDEVAILRDLPISDITPNPNQPRVHFDEESLARPDG
jgi:ParB family chromosome partitioning protein